MPPAIVVVIALCFPLGRFAVFAAPLTRPADTAIASATAFLADPSLPAFANRASVFSSQPDRRHPYFRLALEVGDPGVVSYVDIAAEGETIADYVAGLPDGPLPATIMPQAKCQGIATEFARRQLPALFAPGAEVMCEPDPKIAPNGAYLFSFCRLQQGVRVPPRALVGVRAYDGKVVRWTPGPQPLGVGLEPTLTIEQAVATLTPYLGKSGWVPGMVLESALEVVSFKQNQKLAWGIKMEMHGARSQQPEALEGFCFCHVDANDGTLLAREFPPVGRETYRWYLSRGGTHVPTVETRVPDSLFTDSFPVPSPDGKRILFGSTRPRAGCPEWLPHRPAALFMVNADGTDLTCVIPNAASFVHWGPDANEIAYVNDDLVVLNLDTGERVTFPTDHEHEYRGLVWLRDGQIVAIYSCRGYSTQLVVLDPRQPAVAPVELTQPTTGGQMHEALAIDRQGRLLYTIKTRLDATPGIDQRRNKHPYRLCRLDITHQDAQEEVLADYLLDGVRVVPGPDGNVYLNCRATGTYLSVDPATGATGTWQGPRIACPDSVFRAAVGFTPNDFVFLSDGSMLFSAQYYGGRPNDERAQVLYTCRADGSAPRLITRPERGAAPAFVFPATGKPAFE